MMPENLQITKEVTLLTAWALRICLKERAAEGDAFARQMTCCGDAHDLLRAEACAQPTRNASRVGLIVQPYDWALALAMLDLSDRRRRGIDRRCAHKGLVTTLETSGVAVEIEDEAAAFVELAARFLATWSEESPRNTMGCSLELPPLYGACEQCGSSTLRCHRFTATPHRPEVCMCVHGASFHACIDPREMSTAQHCGDFLELGRPSAKSAAIPRVKADGIGVTPTPSKSTALIELLRHCSNFLSSVGNAGIRDLLGLKRTAGSMEGRLPPPRRTLLEALNMPHAPATLSKVEEQPALCSQPGKTSRTAVLLAAEGRATKRKKKTTLVCNLTVGGRALCKHAVRSTSSWWGGYGGTELDKNDRAEKAVLRVLAGATWINLHVFGGGGVDGVFEVREESGYGARWSADGAVFRGFLEPHMDDGHAKGWRH